MAGTLWGIGMLQAGSATADFMPPPSPATRDEHIPVDPGRITFDYRDFSGLRHRFDCHVDPIFIEQEDASFGYPVDQETNLKELDRRLAEDVKKQAGPLAGYARLEITHAPVDLKAPLYQILWAPTLGSFAWASELPSQLAEEAARIQARVLDPGAFASQVTRVYGEYLLEKGFDYRAQQDSQAGRFDIAYKHFADRARPQLADCFDRFEREAGAADHEEIIQLLLAAFQEIRFELPPYEENGLYRAGFWVPARVLATGRGDCDSKATALCALRQKVSPQMILFILPLTEEERKHAPPEMPAEHVLLGIEALSGPDQATVQIGLRSYVLCEVILRRHNAKKLAPGELISLTIPTSGFCMTDDCNGVGL